MPDDETSVESAEAARAQAPASTTPGGYSYEVVGEEEPRQPGPSRDAGRGLPLWGVVAAVAVAAIAAGLAVWFLTGSSDGDESLSITGSGLLNAFTAGGEADTRRFEGALPPGYPDDVPVYGNSTLVSSVLQVSDPNAGFIVVHHSDDDRDVVAKELSSAYSEGSWQVDGGQENRDATLLQFSKVDDATVSGIVLLTQSKDGLRTTIITSIQDADGASAIDDEAFTEPSRARNSPPGFPSEVTSYEGALLIESAYQKEARGRSFALSYITRDEADTVEEFYRDSLEDAGLTVEDGDASASILDDARVLAFVNADSTLQGEVAIGGFAEDDAFTRIDVQLGDERAGSGSD